MLAFMRVGNSPFFIANIDMFLLIITLRFDASKGQQTNFSGQNFCQRIGGKGADCRRGNTLAHTGLRCITTGAPAAYYTGQNRTKSVFFGQKANRRLSGGRIGKTRQSKHFGAVIRKNMGKKTTALLDGCFVCRHRPIFPGRLQPSIFGTNELNFRVRDGNGWTLIVIDTDYAIVSATAAVFF